MLRHDIYRNLLAAIESLVLGVVHYLTDTESAVAVLQLWLVEGLGLVEAKAVVSADLVGVLVRLCFPESTVPVLPVARVAGGKLVADELLNFEHVGVVKLN